MKAGTREAPGLTMHAMVNRAIWAGAAAAALFAAGPALADVKRGVDAWSQGNYALAVREWEGPAAAGDPDAMFNLGQAYRLGRGVPVDQRRAETLYARAAAAGHVKAADTYGLMLFQDGRREAALPYVAAAAARGDPRSQYLLGIAHFNGDIVPRDWVRAYALLTRANAQGLPQAGPALAQMDEHIPLAQRQQAAALAVQMQREADIELARTLAADELSVGVAAAVQPVPAVTAPATPRPAPTSAVSPSVAAARAAVAEAGRATGTENPADAGASFARGPGQSAPAQAVASRPQAPAARPPARAAASAAAAPQSSGPWRVQLGAFAVSGNAEKLWSRLSGRSELAGRERLLVPAGRVTKLLAAGYPTQAAADAACRSLKQSGQDCLVTR